MKKKLLLHVCCAPCLLGVYDQIKDKFEVVLFWYNPNICPASEHTKRLDEVVKLSKIFGCELIVDDEYAAESFNWLKLTQSLAEEKEGGKRCTVCFRIRLLKTAAMAEELNFEHFATTLTVSPYKNTVTINKVGKEVESKFEKLAFFDEDFGNEAGVKKSLDLSKKLEIYRQKYCGCKYSIN